MVKISLILKSFSFYHKACQIEVVQIDVGNDESCIDAAKEIKAKGVKLYALVNNAGVARAAEETVINTNFLR